jgi:hypothetical protein
MPFNHRALIIVLLVVQALSWIRVCNLHPQKTFNTVFRLQSKQYHWLPISYVMFFNTHLLGVEFEIFNLKGLLRSLQNKYNKGSVCLCLVLNQFQTQQIGYG